MLKWLYVDYVFFFLNINYFKYCLLVQYFDTVFLGDKVLRLILYKYSGNNNEGWLVIRGLSVIKVRFVSDRGWRMIFSKFNDNKFITTVRLISDKVSVNDRSKFR